MLLAREETFGPLLPLLPFDTEDEVIRRANDSEYGLTASVWTQGSRARQARQPRARTSAASRSTTSWPPRPTPALPFGGVKHSGFGRYKGEHGLHAFCNVKSVLVDKDSAKIEANWYPYTRGEVPALHRADREPVRRARREAIGEVRARRPEAGELLEQGGKEEW